MFVEKPIQLNLQDRSMLEAKPIYFNYRQIQLYVIGCGGTGSFLVPHLCRIANFLNEFNREIEITLVDFDEVEEKNLYRQNFCRKELGWNKAMALTLRYKTLYPQLDIYYQEAVKDYLNLYNYLPTIIVSCVDNVKARKNITTLITKHSKRILDGINLSPVWWLDCGNDYIHGQVAIGNIHSTNLVDYKLEPLICQRLPLPSLQYPQLLIADQETKPISCAEQALLNGQSLNINCHMAAIASEMINQLLQSQLKRMNVEIDIFRGNMKSTFTSQESIDSTVIKASKALRE